MIGNVAGCFPCQVELWLHIQCKYVLGWSWFGDLFCIALCPSGDLPRYATALSRTVPNDLNNRGVFLMLKLMILSLQKTCFVVLMVALSVQYSRGKFTWSVGG